MSGLNPKVRISHTKLRSTQTSERSSPKGVASHDEQLDWSRRAGRKETFSPMEGVTGLVHIAAGSYNNFNLSQILRPWGAVGCGTRGPVGGACKEQVQQVTELGAGAEEAAGGPAAGGADEADPHTAAGGQGG